MLDITLTTMEMLDTSSIRESEKNLRGKTDYDVSDLANSIRQQGVLQPIIVRYIPELYEHGKPTGHYEIIAGHRRFKAAQIVGLSQLPAIIMNVDDQQAEVIRMVENLQREDIHPLEEAEGYEKLLSESGYRTVDELAVKVGKSKSYIYQRMKLCDLTKECRAMFKKNKFAPSVALLLARIPSSMQDEAASAIIDENRIGGAMSYRKAKEYIHDNYMLQLKAASFDVTDADLVPKAGKCADCPKRTGNQADLFADITNRADVCTDPLCFKRKTEAHEYLVRSSNEIAEDKPVESSSGAGNTKKATDDNARIKEKKAKEQKRLRAEIRRETAKCVLEKVIKSHAEATVNYWPLLSRYQLSRCTPTGIDIVCKSLGIKEGCFALKREIDNSPNIEHKWIYLELVIACIAAGDGNDWQSDKYSDVFKELCAVAKVDLKAIEKKIGSILRKQKKEKYSPVKKNNKGSHRPLRGAMEFKGADGAKVYVKARTKLSNEDKKAAQDGLSKLAGMFGKKTAKEAK